MPQPIKVDNSHPVTPYETARILGVSRKRVDQLMRAVRRILVRDEKTGEFVVRAKRSKKTVNGSHYGTKLKKAHSSKKTSAARRKA